MPTRRKVLLGLGSGGVAATAGCLSKFSPWSDEEDADKAEDEDDTENSTTLNSSQPKTNSTTDTESPGGNESSEPTAANETNGTNETNQTDEPNQTAAPPEEESTQSEATEIESDSAVEVSRNRLYANDNSATATGEVWNVSENRIEELVVKVTFVDGNGNALTDDPIIDGTFGLEVEDLYRFDARTTDSTVASRAEAFEYSVRAWVTND